MKQFKLDKRTFPNGKSSNINLSNSLNLYRYIQNVITDVNVGSIITLDDISDVDIAIGPLAAGQVLTWNGTAWQNVAQTASGWTRNIPGGGANPYLRPTTATDGVGIGTVSPTATLGVVGDTHLYYEDADSIQYRTHSGTVSSGGALPTPPGPGMLSEMYSTSNYYAYTTLLNSDSTEYGGGGGMVGYYETKLKALTDSITLLLDLSLNQAKTRVTNAVNTSQLIVDATGGSMSVTDGLIIGSIENTLANVVLTSSDLTVGSLVTTATFNPYGYIITNNDGAVTHEINASGGILGNYVYDGVAIDASVEIVSDAGDTFPGIKIKPVREYADNAAAVLAGLTVNSVYRTGDVLKIVH